MEQADQTSDNLVDAKKATTLRAEFEQSITKAEKVMDQLQAFLDGINRDWRSIRKRVLGPVLYSPPIQSGVGDEQFTEDRGVSQIDRTKLGPDFQGNVMDLGAFDYLIIQLGTFTNLKD